MRNRTYVLKIEPWKEGPAFDPVLKRARRKPRHRRPASIDLSDKQATFGQTLKPIGFSVAYSYTLFRKGEGPHHPLYQFF